MKPKQYILKPYNFPIYLEFFGIHRMKSSGDTDCAVYGTAEGQAHNAHGL